MSRMVKLKSNRRKSKVKAKATVSGLALALTIGAVGSMGSYAYFVDKAKAQNDLVITMGNLNTDIEGSLDMGLDKDNKCVTQTFNIKNNGSLKQNVALGFSKNSMKDNGSLKEYIALGIYKNINSMNASQLENLSCTLNISYNGKVVIPKGYSINTFNDLINMQNKELVYSNDKKLVSLDSNKELNCTVSISIKDGLSEEQMKSLQEKQFEFDTEVDAIQIDSKGGSNNEI